MEPNKNIGISFQSEREVADLAIVKNVVNFSTLLADRAPIPNKVVKNKARFQGPLGHRNLIEPYQFPEAGFYREWQPTSSTLSLVELTIDNIRSLAIVNKLDDSAVIFQPNGIIAHDSNAASGSLGYIQFDIQKLETSCKNNNNEDFADAIMGVIHEGMHIEDTVNQPKELLRIELSKLCSNGGQADISSSRNLESLIESGIVTHDEMVEAIQIIATLDGSSSMYSLGKKEEAKKTDSEKFRDLIVEIIIERRNYLITKSIMENLYGSLDEFDTLCGAIQGTTNTNCDSALNSRRDSDSISLDPLFEKILKMEANTPLHHPLPPVRTKDISFNFSTYGGATK